MTIEQAWRPTRAPEVLTEDFGDAIVLYDPRTDRFHRLNAAGRVLWLACDGNATLHEISRSTELPIHTRDTIAAFLKQLSEEELLV